jgi:hypothetical protein
VLESHIEGVFTVREVSMFLDLEDILVARAAEEDTVLGKSF